jgi:hypothetical protein
VYERDKFGVPDDRSSSSGWKIFNRKPVTPPAASGFRRVTKPGRTRHHWPLAAILSILFALAGLRYAIHNWHHPYDPSPLAAPLLGVAILLGAWNRFSRRRG